MAKGFEVLLREHGSRREHRDLPAFHHRFKSGADRHFRFPETDVATDEPIHRARLLHVVLGGVDRLQLIDGFAIGE